MLRLVLDLVHITADIAALLAVLDVSVEKRSCRSAQEKFKLSEVGAKFSAPSALVTKHT